MAVYNTGSVRVKVGSATITGNGTDFKTYVSAGEMFKLTAENVVYTISAVYTATKLSLSARYANTSEETVAEEDNVATCTDQTKTFAGFLAYTPVIQDSVKLTASYLFEDDGGGELSATPYGMGNIDYDTGYYSISFTATLSQDYTLTASYNYGNTLEHMPYQIIRDYTTNYNLPESVPSDKNLAYIYTKAMRMIDEQMKDLEDRIASLEAA